VLGSWSAWAARQGGEMMARFPRVRWAAASRALVTTPGSHDVFLAALPFAVVAVVALVDVLAGPTVGFLPVLSLGPALAAISCGPLPTALIGTMALVSGALLAVYDNLADSRRGVIALCAITGVTIAGVIASAVRRQRERELADFKAIADAAQQILLRPVPRRIPPVDIAVRYVSAAASARIGGDLYEAISAGGGVRLIIGDVLGKGLPAARTAAVVLGAFRASAYDAAGLTQIAARIEASLQQQETEEEFVTGVLAQVSADGREAQILNYGHPPPLLVRDGEAIAAGSAEPGLPLGLTSLAPGARQVSAIPLKHGDRLLFYTDGIAEARDRQGNFYPLEQAGALLGLPDLDSALDRLIEDVLRHVGHALADDAAMLLIGLGQSLPHKPYAHDTAAAHATEPAVIKWALFAFGTEIRKALRAGRTCQLRRRLQKRCPEHVLSGIPDEKKMSGRNQPR
jgi:serine phosphatase RsbU (regulator of sigma subunit)